MGFVDERDAIVDRYLAGEQSLESAASAFASVVRKQMIEHELSRPRTLEQLINDRPPADLLAKGRTRELSDEEYTRMQAFFEAVEQKIDDLLRGPTN